MWSAGKVKGEHVWSAGKVKGLQVYNAGLWVQREVIYKPGKVMYNVRLCITQGYV